MIEPVCPTGVFKISRGGCSYRDSKQAVRPYDPHCIPAVPFPLLRERIAGKHARPCCVPPLHRCKVAPIIYKLPRQPSQTPPPENYPKGLSGICFSPLCQIIQGAKRGPKVSPVHAVSFVLSVSTWLAHDSPRPHQLRSYVR